MQSDFNIEEYLSKGIETLVSDVIKTTFKNPKESVFLLKYAASVKKAGKLRAEAEKRGDHIPPFLIASITGMCNLRCAGCYAHATSPCARAELGAPEWERLFAEAKELGISVVILAGGEPFLRPDVLEKAANCPEVLFPIFTNGTVLGETEYSLLDARRNLVPIISVEGDETLTDARRGAGVYSRLDEAMARLSEMKILFGASITVTKENLEQVTNGAFIDNLYRMGCKIVFYVEYVPFESESLALDDAERALLETRLAELRKKEMIFISFPGDEAASGGCLAAGRGFFHIAVNGDAEPCPFSPYSDTNLRNLSLKDALRSPLFTKLTRGDFLLKEHTGGCVLFGQSDIVKSLI